MRQPGLIGKLELVVEGPFKVIEVPNEYHVVISSSHARGKAKQGKRLHTNLVETNSNCGQDLMSYQPQKSDTKPQD